MTYNWNTMVEITVPTGTNGWLYSGEVIINGVKVRFPVGVPTSVPEPAAVLLKKMIELEQEEDANTAKPQNHYVGDVTIPAGKTLTIEKGANFVDNSSPTEVVILPETELKVLNISETIGQYLLDTPFENRPTGGSTCKFIWGGVEYTSPVVDATAAMGASLPALVCGNSDMLNITENIGSNPAPDAPFCTIITPDGFEEDGVTIYLTWTCSGEIVADPPVISIVQVGAASGEESAGGGVYTVNCNISTNYIDGTTVFSDADKTWAEVVAAHNAGMPVRIVATYTEGTAHMDFVGDCRVAMIGTNNDCLVVSFPSNMLCSAFKPFTLSNDGGALKFALFTD